MRDIFLTSGKEIIDTQNIFTIVQQAFAQMGPKKACTSSNQYTFVQFSTFREPDCFANTPETHTIKILRKWEVNRKLFAFRNTGKSAIADIYHGNNDRCTINGVRHSRPRPAPLASLRCDGLHLAPCPVPPKTSTHCASPHGDEAFQNHRSQRSLSMCPRFRAVYAALRQRRFEYKSR